MRDTIWLLLLTVSLVLAGCPADDDDGADDDGADDDAGDDDAGDDDGADDDAGDDDTFDPFSGDVDAYPTVIGEVLTNPGMGFADFHFSWWCNLPPVTYTPEECAERVEEHWPENYPDAGTAYFRWHWRDLEPQRDQIDTAMIDTTIQSANALDETLGFRVMVIDEGGLGVPQWLTEAPYDVAGEWIDGTFWPDVRDPTFLAEHQRFLAALGDRYDGHPGVDHVDIGTVGCWGEWNTACLSDVGDIFEVYDPQTTADEDEIQAGYEALIDHHLDAFPATPVVMLGIGGSPGRELDVMLHATGGGAGWRVDCWGDWGFWGGNWTHMEDYYPPMIDAATTQDPTFADVWQRAPIQLEVCGVMGNWYDFGWTAGAPDGLVYQTFQWSLDVHASVLNAKSSAVPADYVSAVDDLLVANGYRFVLERLNHDSVAAAGGTLLMSSEWSNAGTTPAYHPRTLTWRLRADGDEARLASVEDTRSWLPGPLTVVEPFTVPVDLPPGSYDLEVALLDRAGTAPETDPLAPLWLGIDGRDADGWYLISQITVE
jgi:Domain of unknown function (DUF4832)